MFCKFCGSAINDGAAFCKVCGKAVPQPVAAPAAVQVAPCPHCGQLIPLGADFCRYCGSSTAEKKKNYTAVTVILAILLAAIIGVGVWKIPANVGTLLEASSVSEPKSEAKDGKKSGKSEESETVEPGSYAPIDSFESVDAALENGTLESPEPADPHPSYGWLYGDESGWEITEDEAAEEETKKEAR
ncbi:MAG: zinc ribbon domain-containing protein [Oscillospiraceae bacterium]|nr:zinc ribbon domain-containing protein [Oscillospiraceae bacterium]